MHCIDLEKLYEIKKQFTQNRQLGEKLWHLKKKIDIFLNFLLYIFIFKKKKKKKNSNLIYPPILSLSHSHPLTHSFHSHSLSPSSHTHPENRRSLPLDLVRLKPPHEGGSTTQPGGKSQEAHRTKTKCCARHRHGYGYWFVTAIQQFLKS